MIIRSPRPHLPLFLLLLLSAVLLLPRRVPAQAPAAVFNPANGHYYQGVSVAGDISWEAARTAAASRVYNGLTGHLATITSAGEQQFIAVNIPQAVSGVVWWLGGYQPPGSPEPAGGWTWITGEPWTYTNWNASSQEPNNQNNNEYALQFSGTPGGGWNDNNGALTFAGYLVEYEASPPPPSGTVTINFDTFSGMPNSAGQLVPMASRLFDQFLSGYGVQFDSNGGYCSVINVGLGHTSSGANLLGGSSNLGGMSYSGSHPISMEFFSPNDPRVPAATNFVSVHADPDGAGGDLTINGYGIDGALVATAKAQDNGGPILQLNQPGIHRVEILGNNSAGFDDLTFNIPAVPVPAPRPVLRVNFDDLTGVPNTTPGVPVPAASRLHDQYLVNYGVRFTSGAQYASVVDHALRLTSGTRGFAGTTPAGLMTYDGAFPILIEFFDPANPANPAATDFVSLRADTDPMLGTNLTINAFNSSQQLIGSFTTEDSGGARLRLAVPGIHYLQVVGNNSATFDDLVFNQPTPVLPVPSAPVSLSAVAATNTQINLAWTDTSLAETGFKIQRRSGTGDYAQIGSVAANVTLFSDTGLQPSTTYTYRVLAFNGGGASLPSNEATATTLRNPPTAPSGLLAMVVNGGRVDLQWTDNSSDEEGFEIERATGNGSFAPLGAVGANAATYSDTSVSPNTTYTYRVRAFVGLAISSYATATPVTTPGPTLVAPSNLTAARSGLEATLTWVDGSNNEDSFLIERAVESGDFVLFKVVGANATTYVDKTLTPGATFTYRIRANLGTTASLPSNTASVTTPPPAPVSPTNLTATAAGSTEIDLVWTDASPNEDGFHVERSTDGTTFTPLGQRGAGETTFADTGLASGTTYFYRVRAFNAGGESNPSNTAQATTAPASPDLPSGLQITNRTQTSISLSWTAGAGATGYEVERGDGTNFTRVGTPTVTNFVDSGLQPNTQYTYRVWAVNAGGFSGYTTNVVGTTLPDPPAAPGNLHADPFSSSAIRLTWSAPMGLTGYRLERSANSGATWTPVGPPAVSDTAFLDGGLQPNTTYSYRLLAGNPGGDSPFAGPVSATTLAALPDPPAAPQNLRVAGLSASSVSLAWNASAGATSYVLERKTGTGEFAAIATPNGGTTSYSDTGVTAGVTYTYRLKARNAGGDSGYSSPVTASVPAGGKLKLSTKTLSFGKVARGKSVQKTLTISNTGRGPLAVNVGTVEAPFSIVLGAGSFTLRPGQSQKVTIRFTPADKVAYSRSLVLTTTDPAAASVNVALTGSGK